MCLTRLSVSATYLSYVKVRYYAERRVDTRCEKTTQVLKMYLSDVGDEVLLGVENQLGSIVGVQLMR
jgi:hypothetical protein